MEVLEWLQFARHKKDPKKRKLFTYFLSKTSLYDYLMSLLKQE